MKRRLWGPRLATLILLCLIGIGLSVAYPIYMNGRTTEQERSFREEARMLLPSEKRRFAHDLLAHANIEAATEEIERYSRDQSSNIMTIGSCIIIGRSGNPSLIISGLNFNRDTLEIIIRYSTSEGELGQTVYELVNDDGEQDSTWIPSYFLPIKFIPEAEFDQAVNRKQSVYRSDGIPVPAQFKLPSSVPLFAAIRGANGSISNFVPVQTVDRTAPPDIE